MNEHDDVERLMERYRPAGPPASLRQRIVTTVPDARPRESSGNSWLAAAAVFLVAAALHAQASRTFDGLVAPQIERLALERAAAIDEMTTLLGGDEFARAAAERWYEASHAIAAAAASAPARLETSWIQ